MYGNKQQNRKQYTRIGYKSYSSTTVWYYCQMQSCETHGT